MQLFLSLIGLESTFWSGRAILQGPHSGVYGVISNGQWIDLKSHYSFVGVTGQWYRSGYGFMAYGT